LDDSADLGGTSGEGEATDGADAALPAAERVEEGAGVVSKGSNDAQSGDSDSPLAEKAHGPGLLELGRVGAHERAASVEPRALMAPCSRAVSCSSVRRLIGAREGSSGA